MDENNHAYLAGTRRRITPTPDQDDVWLREDDNSDDNGHGHDDDGDENREPWPSGEQDARKQVGELKEHILLYIRNLQEIRVTLIDFNNAVQSSTVMNLKAMSPSRKTLIRQVTEHGLTRTTSSNYHVTTHKTMTLAKNENRIYSDNDEWQFYGPQI